MKIFLSTASVQDARWAAESGLADGVVTSPALLRDAAGDGEERELLSEICRAVAGPVCVTAGAIGSADLYRDARELARISDQILVQIPLVEDAVGAMGRLRADGVRVVVGLVYSAAQAVLAAKAGAFMVDIAVDQLDAVGHDGADTVREVSAALSGYAAECDVMASLPAHAAEFVRCVRAGADVVTVTPALLHALLVHPLTDRGLDRLLRDLSAHRRARVPA